MTKKEFRDHCEKQIERCIKLNDSRHLKEHELTLCLLNENERLIQENKELKKQLEEINNFINKAGFVNIQQLMLDYCAKVEEQKEFIEWLENKTNDTHYHVNEFLIYQLVLQKYKEMTGEDSNE